MCSKEIFIHLQLELLSSASELARTEIINPVKEDILLHLKTSRETTTP